MEKRKQVGKLSRSIVLEREGEGDAEVFRASISSEEPYGRWFGVEILDHSEKSIDLSRAASGLPLLWGHDGISRGTVIGRVENVRIEDKRLRGDLRFYSTEAAQEVKTIVREGHREMSVGYQVERMKLVETGKDGQPDTYRVVRWTPMEASIVGVPADHTVGVGRSAEEAAEAIVEVPDQEPAAKADEVPEPQEEAKAAEPVITTGVHMDQQQAPAASNVADIINLGEKYAALGGDKAAQEYLRSGRQDMAEFQAELLARIATKGSTTASDIGMSQREAQQYSFVRALNALANPRDSEAQRAAAFELEASQAASAKSGKQSRGIMVPTDVLRRDLTVGTATAGGHTVATDLLAQSFIELLRNRMVISGLGTTYLTGLNGNIAIPRQTGAATAYWVSESGSPTEGAQAFDQVTMSPKTVGAFVDISRKLLLQSSIDVEAFVRMDLATVLGLEIERVAINGSGTAPEPRGIISTSGIGSVAGGTNGLAPTWAHIVELETDVAAANADVGSLAYLTNAKVRGKLLTTERATGTAQFVWADGDTPLRGYRAAVTNNVPSNLDKGTSTDVCSAIIFGNFADLVIGMWGGLDLMVDPYTGSTSGTTRVVALQDVDVAVRHAESFSAMLDALTA